MYVLLIIRTFNNLINIFEKVLLALMVASISIVHGEPPLSNQYGVPGNYAGGSHQGAQGGGNGFGGHYDGGHHDQDYVDNEVFVIYIYPRLNLQRSRTHD